MKLSIFIWIKFDFDFYLCLICKFFYLILDGRALSVQKLNLFSLPFLVFKRVVGILEPSQKITKMEPRITDVMNR